MIQNLNKSKRICILNGNYCVADFDISEESIEPLLPEIREKIAMAKQKPYVEINVGLYDGGKDIRVWRIVAKT